MSFGTASSSVNVPQRAPHRGEVVLTFGILGVVVCGALGIAAWVMANHDLRLMAMGRMDVSGRGLTQAGRICGIVSLVLLCIQVVGILIWLLFMVSAASAPFVHTLGAVLP